MATKNQIRQAFYTALTGAVSGLVPSDNVKLLNQDDGENVPAVVYSVSDSPFAFNEVGAGPHEVVKQNDVVQYTEVHEYREAQFFVYIRSDTRTEADSIEDAIHDEFGKYRSRHIAKTEDFHTDAKRIEVNEINDSGDPNAEPSFDGTVMNVFIIFKRVYTKNVVPIEEVNHDVEGQTYTTD